MKNSKDKLKVKAGVLLVAWSLIVLSLGAVLGGTVTNDDVNTTTNDSDFEINYENNWIRVNNISINETSWVTNITNSNGNIYPVTETGLQAAIDNLTTGGTIYGNKFNISVTTPILWDDDINFEGAGKASVLYLADGSDCDVIQIDGKSNINIEGICIYGNTDGQSDHVVSLIDLEVNAAHNRNITIKNSYFFNGGKSLIDCQENSSYVTIRDCYFDGRHHSNFGGAIWFSGKNCKAINNYIENVYAFGIIGEASIDDDWESWSSGHLIDGNTVTGECAGGVWLEVNKVANCTIVNNIIFDCNSTAYVVSESWWSKGIVLASYSTCSNNQITNVQKTGIYAGSNNIISDNKLTNITSEGIWFMDNNTITGNKLREIHGEDASNSNCMFSQYEDNIISGNSIYNSVPVGRPKYGLRIVDNNVITGNEFIAEGVSEFGENAIRISGTGKSTIITSNEITGCTYGIRLTDSDYSTIALNTINDADYQGAIWLESSDFVSVSANTIRNSVYGIQIDDSSNSSFMGNIVEASSANHAIYESGTSNSNSFIGNNLNSSTSGITIIGADSIVIGNIGYVTEFDGLCTILDDSTSIVVEHNMSVAPTMVLATPRDNLTTATFWYVDTVTATQFTLHVNDDVTADVSFYWKAEYS